MCAMRLLHSAKAEDHPLVSQATSRPQPAQGQLLLRILACGVCRTDLHLVEGEITPPQLPITPGHQIVGIVEQTGAGVQNWQVGDRAGVPWLYRTCRQCSFCRRGEENLCTEAEFTGFHVDGGFAEWLLADARFALPLPGGMEAESLAPLLCAGIIGFRSLRKADVQPGERLGLVGFGASAHLAIQVARHWGCDVYVFTRSTGHRALARQLGAKWVGDSTEQPPDALDRAILFAPAGNLVPRILENLRPGGTLAINAVHMSPIPEMPYNLIYGERTLRSVANATYQDGMDFLKLAHDITFEVSTQPYALQQANQALVDLKHSRIDGAGVLIP